MGVELDLAMRRQKSGEAVVVPILLRQVDLQPEDAQDLSFVDLLKPQGLPRDLKPVTTWANRDEAWTDVARGLRATVNDIRARRAPMPAAPAVTGGIDTPPRAAPPASASIIPQSGSPLLERVLVDFTRRIAQANTTKGGAAVDETEVRSQALHLIDVPDSKRVLWVDDHPGNNAAETAALAKLKIEVVAVRSTDEALARLADAARGDDFDLVISDWGRSAEGPMAGLRLMAAMRGGGHAQPVLYYHGTTGAVQRAALATTARVAGAFGEAVLPADLIRLVLAALNG